MRLCHLSLRTNKAVAAGGCQILKYALRDSGYLNKRVTNFWQILVNLGSWNNYKWRFYFGCNLWDSIAVNEHTLAFWAVETNFMPAFVLVTSFARLGSLSQTLITSFNPKSIGKSQRAVIRWLLHAFAHLWFAILLLDRQELSCLMDLVFVRVKAGYLGQTARAILITHFLCFNLDVYSLFLLLCFSLP